MSVNDQFSRYRAMVAEMAMRGLHERAGARRSGEQSLSLAAPAARLLMRDDRDDYAGLVAALEVFADLGRPHLTVGVNVGTLAASTATQSTPLPPSSRADLSTRQSPGIPIPGRSLLQSAVTVLCDEAHHTRDVYYPFALHLCLAAFHRRYESLPPKLWSACEQSLLEAVAPLRTVEGCAGKPPPANLTHLMLWHALCLAEQAKLLQRDIDLETVDAAVHTMIAGNSAGPLHAQESDDSPDAWTWRELTGLHALANLALLRRNNAWAKRVEQIALYHLEHTQPDNTTNQPWAVFAFLWSVKTRSFAEQQLHDATAHGIGLTAGMLLADAANALAEFAT